MPAITFESLLLKRSGFPKKLLEVFKTVTDVSVGLTRVVIRYQRRVALQARCAVVCLYGNALVLRSARLQYQHNDRGPLMNTSVIGQAQNC